jgi:hypothetical protein
MELHMLLWILEHCQELSQKAQQGDKEARAIIREFRHRASRGAVVLPRDTRFCGMTLAIADYAMKNISEAFAGLSEDVPYSAQ